MTTAVQVSDTAAAIIAVCTIVTTALCLWAVPHHRRSRDHRD